MFLHSKERWFTMAGSELQEIKPSHNKEQDPTVINALDTNNFLFLVDIFWISFSFLLIILDNEETHDTTVT